MIIINTIIGCQLSVGHGIYVFSGKLRNSLKFSELLGTNPVHLKWKYVVFLLAIMALIGFSSYCTLKLLFSWVTVLPPRVTVQPQI
jgi:ABC-type microcin C transport system permease subunit YejE